MQINEIKIGGFYKLESPVTTRDKDVQIMELLIKVVEKHYDHGTVEIVFPPFNHCRFADPCNLSPLG